MEILDRIHNESHLPLDLYMKLKQSLRFKYDKDSENVNNLLDDLSPNLRIQTAIFIHEKTWSSIEFFEESSDAFITWVCPRLKPTLILEDSMIYSEGDLVKSIYFLQEGDCGCVLPPDYHNLKYVNIKIGDYFGIVDIIGSAGIHKSLCDLNSWLENWYKYR